MIALRTLTFSSRTDSLSVPAGGSIARLARTWSRWFWTTSRIVAGLFVEGPAALDAELLRHRDLHALDVLAVPDRLQERVGEAEVEQVLDRLLAEVMVDAEDRRLVEVAQQDAVEGLRRGEVVPNGFSMMTRAPAAQPDLPSCSTTTPNSAGGMAR